MVQCVLKVAHSNPTMEPSPKIVVAAYWALIISQSRHQYELKRNNKWRIARSVGSWLAMYS